MIEHGSVKLLNSIFSVIMYDLRKIGIREWMVLGEKKIVQPAFLSRKKRYKRKNV